jgi:hypothetical protein
MVNLHTGGKENAQGETPSVSGERRLIEKVNQEMEVGKLPTAERFSSTISSADQLVSITPRWSA